MYPMVTLPSGGGCLPPSSLKPAFVEIVEIEWSNSWRSWRSIASRSIEDWISFTTPLSGSSHVVTAGVCSTCHASYE